MLCNSPRSLAIFVHSVILQLVHCFMLSAHDALGLPLPRLPFIFPSMICFRIVSCLYQEQNYIFLNCKLHKINYYVKRHIDIKK